MPSTADAPRRFFHLFIVSLLAGLYALFTTRDSLSSTLRPEYCLEQPNRETDARAPGLLPDDTTES
jgi:hypothetical protein